MPLPFPKLPALALAALLAVPAHAANGYIEPDEATAALGAAGGSAYERGRNSGVTPQTLGEMAMCTAYWDQWTGAIDAFAVSDELLISLPEEVDESAAYRTAEAWFDRASEAYQAEEGHITGLLDRANAEKPRAAERIIDGVDGDVRAFEALMEMLGTCHID